jgi:hypothetical protein
LGYIVGCLQMLEEGALPNYLKLQNELPSTESEPRFQLGELQDMYV